MARLSTSTAQCVQTSRSMDTTNRDPAIPTRKILFVTNSESGQANTILAMALEATTRPHVEVHIASFPVLKRRVERLSPNINFHALDGTDLAQMMVARGFSEENVAHPPTTKSFKAYRQMMPAVLAGWDGDCVFCFLLRIWVVTELFV